jgi:hypothetical protein
MPCTDYKYVVSATQITRWGKNSIRYQVTFLFHYAGGFTVKINSSGVRGTKNVYIVVVRN